MPVLVKNKRSGVSGDLLRTEVADCLGDRCRNFVVTVARKYVNDRIRSRLRVRVQSHPVCKRRPYSPVIVLQ